MPRAGHHVAVHNSLAKRPPAVQAGIVDGIELATNVRQGDRFTLDLELPDRPRSNLIRLRGPRKRHCILSSPFFSALSVPFALDSFVFYFRRSRHLFSFTSLLPYFLTSFTSLPLCFLSGRRTLRHHHSLPELVHHLRL